MNRYVLSGAKVHADDTPVPVLAPGEGKTKTGRLWTYVRDDRPAGEESSPAVWFAYSPNPKCEQMPSSGLFVPIIRRPPSTCVSVMRLRRTDRSTA